MLVSEIFDLFGQTIFGDTVSITCSPASAAGPMRSAVRAGQTMKRSGRRACLVNRFRSPDSGRAIGITDISGPLFTAASPSASLQSCLENSLRARMDVNGSPEYELTWKAWDMPAGPQIC